LKQLRSTGTKLQIRSVLLQGLLGMEPADVPEAMPEARAAVAALRGVLGELGLPLPQAALAYALSLDADRVIVAADSADQLEELLGAADLELPAELDDELDTALGELSPAVLDPRAWPRVG
jgi:aryl-alcohol dehydrogenase-like predicted oxidoreductase